MATKRLIDANALAENWFYTNDTGIKVVELLEIEQAPTVDAVEVVRCGKCKWFDPESDYCQFWHGLRNPGHYCREGERKDNDSD